LVSEAGNTFVLTESRFDPSSTATASSGTILSPMPGKIIAVEVRQGQKVTKGQKLLTLEAMKMEHNLIAPFDGVVAELTAVVGDQVQVEAVLARIETAMPAH
jgi:3-methylcrotonyl-CoA carboxylase alpha subunit